jgi:hypothetical protein
LDLGGVDVRNEARVHSALSDVEIDAVLIIPKSFEKGLLVLLIGTNAIVLLVSNEYMAEMIENLSIK